jgi:hypothetical protein
MLGTIIPYRAVRVTARNGIQAHLREYPYPQRTGQCAYGKKGVNTHEVQPLISAVNRDAIQRAIVAIGD